MFEETKKKGTIFTILGVFILLITIVGVAVAAYTWTYAGTKANTIGTGSVSLSLLESTDVINITNALPTADASGMALGSDQSFDFAVTTYASGNPGDITYSLNISKLTIDSGYSLLPDNGVKVYLTALTDGGEVQVVKPTLVSNIITSGSTGLLTFDSGKTNYLTHNHDTGDTTKTTKYRLRMWIDQTVDSSNWNENTKNQYKLKIGVGTGSGEDQSSTYVVYSWSVNQVYAGTALNDIYGYTSDYATLGEKYFLKHYIDSSTNKVESSETCYILNGTAYCLKGGVENVEASKNILLESFGSENCTTNSTNLYCTTTGFYAYVYDSGMINVASGAHHYCRIDAYADNNEFGLCYNNK